MGELSRSITFCPLGVEFLDGLLLGIGGLFALITTSVMLFFNTGTSTGDFSAFS